MSGGVGFLFKIKCGFYGQNQAQATLLKTEVDLFKISAIYFTIGSIFQNTELF